jgi:Histone methylation protein DOT1
MRKGSLIDDVELYYGDQGPPICFKNADIRKLLKLGKASHNDTFFDLGSGWGQIIMIALTEFGVTKAVGFDSDRERWKKASKRREGWLRQRPDIKPAQWHLKAGNFDTLLRKGKLAGESLKDATLIFYGLETHPSILTNIKKAWKNTEGRRLLYYYNCLFPEILPSDVDLPFFVSEFPFTRPRNEEEWLAWICGKEYSSLVKGDPALKQELWDELRHDYVTDDLQDDIGRYKRRLGHSVNRGRELGSVVF